MRAGVILMLRRQSWIALGIAVILGLFAVYIANSYLLGSQKRAELAGTTKVAVADRADGVRNRHHAGQGPLRRLSQQPACRRARSPTPPS